MIRKYFWTPLVELYNISNVFMLDIFFRSRVGRQEAPRRSSEGFVGVKSKEEEGTRRQPSARRWLQPPTKGTTARSTSTTMTSE